MSSDRNTPPNGGAAVRMNTAGAEDGWFRLNPGDSPYFEANRRAFLQRYPESAPVLDGAAANLDRIAAKRLPGGLATLRADTPEGGIDFHPEERLAETLSRDYARTLELVRRGARLIVAAGHGLGYLTAALEREYRRGNGPALVAAEPRPELLLAQWILFDARPSIESPNVFWSVGGGPPESLEPLFAAEAFFSLDPAQIAIAPGRTATPSERTRFKSILPWFEQRRRAWMNETAKLREEYGRRIQQPANLDNGRVWAAGTPDAYAHTPLIRSLLSGFGALGFETCFLELREHCASRFKIGRHLMQTAPDIYLLVHTASDRFIPREARRPRVVWYLDHPRHFHWEEQRDSFHEQDFVFYSDRAYAPWFEKTNAGGCAHLPVCPSLGEPGERRADLACPVLFAGNHHPVEGLLGTLSGPDREAARETAMALIANPAQTAPEAAANLGLPPGALERIGNEADRFAQTLVREIKSPAGRLEYYFYALANNIKRETRVRALADLGIAVYGPESWLDILGPGRRAQYRGWLPHGQLADAYASADVCLNLHSIQCPTCLNSRDFDILTAGGCLLGDEVEDMDLGLLEKGVHMETFTGEEDLRERAKSLLADPGRREALRERGRAVCAARHTPANRAETIMRLIRERFAP